VHQRVRSKVPTLEADRPMDEDIVSVLDMLHDGRLLEGIAQ
jgi:histidine ammonia-lyase